MRPYLPVNQDHLSQSDYFYFMSESEFLENLKKFESILKAKSKVYKILGTNWEDRAQEIRIKLWQMRGYFNPNMASFNTWASHLADNCLRKLYRHAKTITQSYLNDAESIEDIAEKE